VAANAKITLLFCLPKRFALGILNREEGYKKRGKRMEDKTIEYTVAFGLIFVFLLGVNQFVHTQEKKTHDNYMSKIQSTYQKDAIIHAIK